MVYKTLLELRTKIETDLDLQDELFITSSEINSYINEAIDDVEAQIHTLYEDYFKTVGNIALVSGTSYYALPTNIYADKIRKIVYQNGPIIFEIKRVKEIGGIVEEKLLDLYPTTMFYKYDIVNRSATTGPEIRFFPPAQETSSTNVEIWYLRNANSLSSDSDKCDIPEFYTYVLAYAKCKCYEKEAGHPNYAPALAERERLKDLMIATLQDRTPDADNEIELDYTFYQDLS